MAVQREEWWAYAGLDVSAFEEGVDELAQLGQAVVSIFRSLDSVRLGNPDAFRQQGREAARAYIEGMRQGLSGLNLQSFIGQQLRIEPAAMRGLEQDLTAIESRIRALGMGSGGRQIGAVELGSMRALEDQASRSTRAMAEANAQLLMMRRQLAEMSGISIPTSVFRRQGDAIQATGPAAAIAAATGVQLQPQLTSRGTIDQAAAREQLRQALQSRAGALESQILAASGQRLALPSGVTPAWQAASGAETARMERIAQRIETAFRRAETGPTRGGIRADDATFRALDAQGAFERVVQRIDGVFQVGAGRTFPAPFETPTKAALGRDVRAQNELVLQALEDRMGRVSSGLGSAAASLESIFGRSGISALLNGNTVDARRLNRAPEEVREFLTGSADLLGAGSRYSLPGAVSVQDRLRDLAGEYETGRMQDVMAGRTFAEPIPLPIGDTARRERERLAQLEAVAALRQAQTAPAQLALPRGPGIGGELVQGLDGRWRSPEGDRIHRLQTREVTARRVERGTTIPSSGEVFAVGAGRPFQGVLSGEATTAEERLAEARQRAERATRGATAAENARAAASGAGGRGGGGRGPGAVGGDEEEDPWEKWVREARSRGFHTPEADYLRDMADEARARSTGARTARESARQDFSDPYDYDRVRERAGFAETRAEQNYRRSRATFQAREMFDPFDEDEFGRSEQERFRDVRRRRRLRDFVTDPGVSSFDKIGPIFSGRAPGDDTPSMPAGQQFLSGFMGSGAQPVMAQLGQTAKFSLFYGAMYTALFQLSQGFAMALQGVIQFEDALVELNLVTSRTRAENAAWADDLGELGTSVGFTAAQGVQAGARAIGLFGVADAPQAVQGAVARQSTEVAGRIAFLSGEQDPEQTQVQLAGLARSFSLGTFGQRDLENRLAYMARQTGASMADIIEGMTQIGTLAGDAGFDDSETAALITQIAKTTGKTPTAVAGSLPQVFSKIDEPAIEAMLREVGVDTQGTTMADQFRQLSQLRESGELPEAQFNQIIQQFGRGFSGQSVRIIVGDMDKIDALAEGARNAPPGQGEAMNAQAMQTFGQQVRLLGRDFIEFGKDLGSTGVADVLYGIVVALRELLQAADHLLDLFNLIPRPMRTAAFLIGEVALATRLLIGQQAFSGLLSTITRGRVGTAVAGASTVARVGAVGAVGTEVLALPGGDDERRRRFSRAGLASAAISAAPIAGIFAALSVADELRNTRQLEGEFTGAMSAGARATTVDQMREAIAQQEEFIRAAEEAQSGPIGLLRRIPGVSTQEDLATARAARDDLEATANALEAAQERANAVSPEAAFGDFSSVDAVNEGLAELTDQGYNAAQQLEFLNRAFDSVISKTGDTATTVATIYQGQGDEFGLRVGTAANTARDEVMARLRKEADELDRGGADDAGFWDRWKSGNLLPRVEGPLGSFLGLDRRAPRFGDREDQLAAAERRDAVDALERADAGQISTDVQTAALQVLRNRGLDPSKGPVFLTDEDVQAVQEEAGRALAASLGEDWDKLGKGGQQALREIFAEELRNTIGDFGGAPVDSGALRSYIQARIPLAQQAGQEAAIMAGGDDVLGATTTRDQYRADLQYARDAIAKMDPEDRAEATRELYVLELALAQAEMEVASSLTARADSLAALAASRLGVDDVVGRTRASITAVQDNLSRATDPTERNRLQAQLNELYLQEEQQARDADQAQSASFVNPRDRQAVLADAIASARENLEAATPGSANEAQLRTQLNQLLMQAEDYALDLVASAALLGIGAGDTVGIAQAAFEDALRRLNAAMAAGADADTINRMQREVQTSAYALAREGTSVAGTEALANIDPRNVTTQIAQQMANLRAQRRVAQNAGDRGGVAQIDIQLAQLEQQQTQERLAIMAAQDRASIRPGDNVGDAAAAMAAARRRLAAALPGQREFWEAQRALADTQQAYVDAVLASRAVERRLVGDITDPLEEARDVIRDALDALANADTPEERNQANLDLARGRANEERIALDQRMRDAQINEQLGRMSHQAYIRYLQSERANLIALGVNTRQRQDMLNEIDLAIKAATDQMQGQFNVGDFIVPTVYEMRRFASTALRPEGYGPGAGMLVGAAPAQTTTVTDNRIVTIQISGGDLATVSSTVEEAANAITTVGSRQRKY